MSSWAHLGAVDPGKLEEARRQCHHAVQVLTRVARGYLEHVPDDSHTSTQWDPERQALIGRPLGRVRFGLRLADLTLLLLFDKDVADSLRLNGDTLPGAFRWTQGRLREAGFEPAPFLRPLHFEIPEHAVAAGGEFQLSADRPAFEELARWYNNAALVLGEVTARDARASLVRCWPHHFDIATLISVNETHSVGVGLSPGDESYAQPYFYMSPYPYPPADFLPPAPAGAHWHTKGWTGLVLPGEEIVRRNTAAEQDTWTRDTIISYLDLNLPPA